MSAQDSRRIGRRIGRPYLVWKDDLELARIVNERLAASAPVQPAGPSGR